MLKIHNSQSGTKEEFRPIDPSGQRVGMYYCGPTVYDSIHLGHARAAIVPDVVRRWLEHKGYVVRYVANFTDVDDKIIKRAIREDRDWREITFFYMQEYYRLVALLGNRPVDVQPRATDHIPEMLELVEGLIERGNAYVASDGDVYFDTASFDGYGALSGRNLEDQRAGASGRMSDDQMAVKRQPADFILWKLLANDPDEFKDHPERVPGWDSPWGRGRPGWHLECSALSRHYLGMPFDIHGGGRDLLFPHHENERAQNDCAYCSELEDGGSSVRYWIHNGFITVRADSEAEKEDEHTVGDAAKMSKSLGNVKWIKDMIQPDGPLDPMAVRMLMLVCHYRSPLSFSPQLLDQSRVRVERIYDAVERLRQGLADDPAADGGAAAEAVVRACRQADEDFAAAMDDDFNTPRALAAIDVLINGSRGLESDADRRLVLRTLELLCHTLGLRTVRPPRAGAADEAAEAGLLALLAELRKDARQAKDWARSDRIRDRLTELGFEVRDRPGGESEIVRA